MTIINTNRKKSWLALAMLAFLAFSVQAFGQNATVNGTVQDASKGVLPGATVTATNVDTNVETTVLSDSSGNYSFGSLQPGNYTISAELEGFQKFTAKDVNLNAYDKKNLEFTLQVASLVENLEVVTTAQDILTESSPTAGTVLTNAEVTQLPLIDNDVLDLVNIMGGVQSGVIEGSDLYREAQSFAGVDTRAINIQQDGLNINDVSYKVGINSSSRINPEMVAEFKLVLSPVDAEYGRGMGQVQIITRTGTNAWHGSGVWNIRNSALNSAGWRAASQTAYVANWRNVNTININVSGPIIKNKTFFFATYDQAISRTKDNIYPQVATACARKGIFRYFAGWDSRDVDSVLQPSQTTGPFQTVPAYRPVTDYAGVPLDENLFGPGTQYNHTFVGMEDPDIQFITGFPDGYTAPAGLTPGLKYVSVFGPLDENSVAYSRLQADLLDCSQYDPYNLYDAEGNVIGAYDPDQPLSATSQAALGINYYWETGASPAITDPAWFQQPYRRLDTGYIKGFISEMPLPNFYGADPSRAIFGNAGDGLNMAVHRWQLQDTGSSNQYGGGNERRKNLTFRINHNFTDRHRASGSWTIQRSGGQTARSLWPNGYSGDTVQRPQRFNVSLNSTLRPYLLNQANLGLNRNYSYSNNAVDTPGSGDELRAKMLSFLDTRNPEWEGVYPQGYPIIMMPMGFGGGAWASDLSHYIGGSIMPTWGSQDNRWQISDTLTWIRGRHSFKFGGEVRLTRAYQEATGKGGYFAQQLTYPTIQGGVTPYSQPQDLITTVPGHWQCCWTYIPATNTYTIPGTVGAIGWGSTFSTTDIFGTGTVPQLLRMRDFQAGSIGQINQFLFINQPNELVWNDIANGDIWRVNDLRQKEMAFFAKDDWRVSNSLTLNLGLRWEYYGVPYLARGMTIGVTNDWADGTSALFGVTGNSFSTWMAEYPVNLGPDYYTRQAFIGPGSPNPDIPVFNKDLNNFGPAVGFAYQIPWFGRGKTTIRGGYQLSYSQISNANLDYGFGSTLASTEGTVKETSYSGAAAVGQPTSETYQFNNAYMDVADVWRVFPITQYLDPSVRPLNTLSMGYRSDGTRNIRVYDPNIRNPYTQSLNFSVMRTIGSHVTLQVRYVGTLARKQISDINLNSANWLNNHLKEAFDAARAGGTAPMLDDFFYGLTMTFPVVDNGSGGTMPNPWNTIGIATCENVGVDCASGGDAMRNLSNFYTNLANGNYNAVASTLADYNFTSLTGGDTVETNLEGALLRRANRLYEERTGVADRYPENFILHNPQINTANFSTNNDHNNYHSMQVQFTLRPTHGFNFTSTYTWSKNLGLVSYRQAAGYPDPNDRANPFNYTQTGNSRTHQINFYGGLTLPFGPNGFFLRDVSNPVVRRIIEGWDLSWIMSMGSGGWTNINADGSFLWTSSAGYMSYLQPGSSVPDIIRPDLIDFEGHVTWEPGADHGYYFGDPNQYMIGPDPQCSDLSLVSSDLSSRCTLSAMYVPWDTVKGQVSSMLEVDEPDYANAIVIMQNPLPAHYGNLGQRKTQNIGSFSLDMAMGKTVQLTEGKSLQIRVDASNILNHPTPSGPNFTIQQSGNGFGYISRKYGNRTFQGKITLRF